ncbi:MAG: outer membrane protein insertion porin family [Phenylobacterium sp.]|jgi:outer membrane protein insertion porin family
MMVKRILPIVLLAGASLTAAADDKFVVEDMKVQGLQRVTVGAALTHIPFSVGDEISDFTLTRTVRLLYGSGFFDDIEVLRDGDQVVFSVRERPIIDSVVFDGNKDIKDEQLTDSLEGNGLLAGETLDRTTIQQIKNGLLDFFHSVGKYNASMDINVIDLPRNRVKLDFTFNEGTAASVKQINIVGNTVFSDQELLKEFESEHDLPWWKFMSDDRYRKQTLQGDFEKLKSFYLDRGYLRFNVDSTQVSVTPDKDAVYVTLNVDEGEQYTVTGFDFIGDLLGREETLRRVIPITKGELYNGAVITYTEKMINQFMSRFGYADSKVQTIPDIDEENKEVKLTIQVTPGKRIYVNRINFVGNGTTSDEVMRREIRQMEGSWLSNDLLELSKNRIQRLAYMESVEFETKPVPGEDDKVDVTFTIKEQLAGSFNVGVSYGDFNGLAFQAGVQQSNFLGTGNRVGLGLNTSKGYESFNLSYTDPYFTIDAVSLGGSLSYSSYDASKQRSFTDYRSESYALGAVLGFPIDEANSLNAGLTFKYENVSRINEYEQIKVFKSLFEDPDNPDKGIEYTNLEASFGWYRSTLNRGTFPSDGSSQSAQLKVTIPGSDVQYFKLSYNASFYYPLNRMQTWTVMAKAKLGYGNGFGDKNGFDQVLPFRENFRSGQNEVRGFEPNTIGPKAVYKIPQTIPGSPDENGEIDPRDIILGPEYDIVTTLPGNSRDQAAVGGNAIATGSLSLIFPLPFISEEIANSIRTSFFVDAGNIWDTEFDYGNLAALPNNDRIEMGDYSDPSTFRASGGLSLQWLSPMGPMIFNFAKAFKDFPGDKTKRFSFNIGTTF